MKRLISILLFVCAILSLSVILTSCGHEHTYNTEWKYDEANHWHECEGKDCAEVSDTAAHSFDNACDTTCACGYTRSVNHDFTGEWQKNDAEHWHVCKTNGCDVTDTKAAHTWNEGEITTPATKEADGVKTFTCTACAQTKTESVKLVNTLTKEEWVSCLNSANVTMSAFVEGTLYGVNCWGNNSFVAKNANGQVQTQQVCDDGVWYYLRESAGVMTANKTGSPIDKLCSLIFRRGDLEALYDQLTYDEATKEYTLITDEFDNDIEYYRFYCENGKIMTMEVKNNEMSGSGIVKYVFSDWGSTVVTVPEYTIK